MRKIMILGASILQLPAIKKAKEMGLSVVVADMNPQAIGFTVPEIEKEIISTIDIPGIVEVAEKHHINGIMTLATDMPMRSVAAVSEKMGLVGINMDTAIKATNKVEMRRALKKYNVPIPEFYKISNREEYYMAVQKFTHPFIVKPADSSGSRGIYLINNLSDKEEIEKAYIYSREYSKVGDVIIEEYMKGEEVSVETLTVDGVCHVIQITDKLTTGAPHFVEMGHSQPTHHSKEIVEKIVEVTKMANKAIGIKNGPSHTEIMVTDEGPKIVELGARLGGDNINTHLVPLSTGVDMVESCIKIALGEKPDLRKKYEKAAAIRYFNIDRGTIKSISGIEEAKKIQGIQQIYVVHGVGDTINGINSSGDRAGFVIAQADDVEKAIKICEEANKMIKVEVNDV